MIEKSSSPENKNNKQENKIFEIPINGSLGLLALGAVGIKAWRKKREEEQKKHTSNTSND